MLIYNTDSQFREKHIIWRIMQNSPLRNSLLRGRMFRWFGVNIPLSLVGLEGDLDIVLSLLDAPPISHRLYETCEVKVSLIGRDGQASSLKSSSAKKKQLLGQLRKYRAVGSPAVTLLDVYLCHSEHVGGTSILFPKPMLKNIASRQHQLEAEGFGCWVMPFGHEERAEDLNEVDSFRGLRAVQPSGLFSTQTHFTVLNPQNHEVKDPFVRLIAHLEDFVESERTKAKLGLGFIAVTYCLACATLIVLPVKEEPICPNCSASLAEQ